MMPPMTPTHEDDLRKRLSAGNVLFIVGTGVSAGAVKGDPLAPFASWEGLIREGIAECERVAGLPGRALDGLRQNLASEDQDQLLSAAGVVCRKLGGPAGGAYRSW